MKLNLGSGPDKRPDYVNVDIRPGADIIHDLTVTPWPWGDGTIEEIISAHLVEHLPSIIPFLNECHRILIPGGKCTIETPNPMSEFFWQDPTHVRGYTPNTFLLYCAGADGTEHCGIVPWKHVGVWEHRGEINSVPARITKATLTK